MLEEAHESKLKSGVKAKVNFAYKMIDHMVSLLKVQLTEEKDVNELMEKVEKMEKSPKDFGFHLKSIESFIESNDLLQEAYGGVYDIVEQQKWERLFNSN